MKQLREALAQVRERIIRCRDPRTMNEENTKRTLVEPTLRALGWDIEDVEEVRGEFKRKKSDKPVDYALLLLRTPRLFVEVKALGENLSERRWANQIMGYASVAGVEWVILTNGDEYQIYNSHATVDVEEKLFRTVRISEEQSRPEETLWLLSKDQLKANRIEVLWTAHFVDRQVRSAVEGLLGEAPDASLIRLVARKVPTVSRKDVKASLARARVHLDFPVEEIETDESTREPDGEQPGDERGADISLTDLIRVGLLTPPLKLEKDYKGRHLIARITKDGKVEFAGKVYNSLSVSAGMARDSVIGKPAGRKYHQTIGWTFWRFREADGRVRPVDELRKRFRSAKRLVVPVRQRG